MPFTWVSPPRRPNRKVANPYAPEPGRYRWPGSGRTVFQQCYPKRWHLIGWSIGFSLTK